MNEQEELENFFDLDKEKKFNLRKKNRLFLPLDEMWHNSFKNGKKKWELRGVNKKFNINTVRLGCTVEIRKGYTQDPLWGIITNRILVNSINEVPKKILDETIPRDVREDPDVVSFMEGYGKKYNKFILFKIKILEEGDNGRSPSGSDNIDKREGKSEKTADLSEFGLSKL